MNGIVGIKPTHALVSQKGVVPLAQSQDVVGPMARNVRDASLLLSAILREGHHHRAERISAQANPHRAEPVKAL